MIKFKDFSRPLSVLKYFSGIFNFQGLFKDIPVYSSTFQACANPGYHKFYKISNTFLSLLSNTCKILIFRTGIHKMLVREANMEDPNQTSSSEVV